MKNIFLVLCLFACLPILKAQDQIEFKKTVELPVPVITFKEQTLDLGMVKKGESRELFYEFTNTGTDFLQIELVTSCHCTTIDWPQGPVAPGASGKIKVVYDSTDQRLGELKKTIDIICNTDPIVVEAFFNVTVVE